MNDYVKRAVHVGVALGAIVGLVGCTDETEDAQGSHEFGVEETNGVLPANGVIAMNGVNSVNGIIGANGVMSANGVSSINGMFAVNGVSEMSGYITTDAGRKTLTYLVRCALNSNDSLTKVDRSVTPNVSYTFAGGLGLCPEWKNGGVAYNQHCQNMVSACLMAHINTSGVHVPLWFDSEATPIGWGTNPNYPAQEGTFFGNLITTGSLANLGMPGINGPAAYFCEGAGITAGVVSGRLTSGITGVPYVNPYGDKVKCIDRISTGGA